MYLIFRQTHFRLTSLVTPCRLAIVQKEVNLWPTSIKERWPAKIRNPISRQVVMSFTSSSAMAITNGHHRAPLFWTQPCPGSSFSHDVNGKAVETFLGRTRSTRSTRWFGPPWGSGGSLLKNVDPDSHNTFKNNNHKRLPYCYNVFWVIAVIMLYCILIIVCIIIHNSS